MWSAQAIYKNEATIVLMTYSGVAIWLGQPLPYLLCALCTAALEGAWCNNNQLWTLSAEGSFAGCFGLLMP